MPAPSSLTHEQRREAIDLFTQGRHARSVAHHLGVAYQPVRRLMDRWRVHGSLTLVPSNTKRHYPYELKLEAATRHAAGEASTDLAVELDVSTPRLVQRWSELYRVHGAQGLQPRPRGRPPTKNTQPEPSQEQRLRRENEELRAQVAYLKKLRALGRQGPR